VDMGVTDWAGTPEASRQSPVASSQQSAKQATLSSKAATVPVDDTTDITVPPCSIYACTHLRMHAGIAPQGKVAFCCLVFFFSSFLLCDANGRCSMFQLSPSSSLVCRRKQCCVSYVLRSNLYPVFFHSPIPSQPPSWIQESL